MKVCQIFIVKGNFINLLYPLDYIFRQSYVIALTNICLEICITI